MTDAQLAAQSGLPESAFRAYREGRPHWTLKDNLRQVAFHMRADYQRLQAALNQAEQTIMKQQVFPGANRAGFSGLTRGGNT